MAVGIISSPATWLIRNVIPVSWLQTIQDDVNGILQGTASIKSMRVDATGGATTTSTAGTIRLPSGTLIGGSSTTVVPQGTMYADTVPFAWGKITSAGAITKGFNITSCSAPASSVFTVTLTDNSVNGTGICVIASVMDSSGGFVSAQHFSTGGGAPNGAQIKFSTFSIAGAAADRAFCFVAI